MRVHVVTASNRGLYVEEIEAMHRHRYEMFVEERGWRALESPDRLDIDEFDNEHASYLIAIDEMGNVTGSARLIPSWRPNILKTLFPEYCEEAVPVGPGIWEWSRHTTPGRRYSLRFNIRTQLYLNIAVIEFGLSRGMDYVYGILESELMPWTAQLGWRSRLLGPARSYGEGMAVASISPILNEQLEQLRREAGLDESILIEAPAFLGARGKLARQWLELAARMSESDITAALQTILPQPVFRSA